MIVTFVSQCEKKAIPRTRQILDAFASRIGDNVWQTVITQEGVCSVKRLLRKTVTKNTAVSCHWIRGRRKTELLWIVGNRNKFNLIGVVPVNLTSKDVFMDVTTMKVKQDESYANTQFQLLAEHSFAVGYIAQQLFKNNVDNDEYENLSHVAFLSGCLHDIGKLDSKFQSWVKKGKQKDPDDDGQHIDIKFTFDKYPRHNEISLLLFNFFEKYCNALNNRQKESIQHVIYWHHAKPFRKKNNFTGVGKVYEVLGNEQINDLIKKSFSFLSRIDRIAKEYQNIDLIDKKLDWRNDSIEKDLSDFEYHFKNKNYPDFKSYIVTDDMQDLQSKINSNAQHNLLRACVISADRLISKLSAQDLIDYILHKRLDELLDEQEIISDLTDHLSCVSEKFPASERTRIQDDIANQLKTLREVAVLAGPAGCGKTKIALEWSKLKNAKRIIWVCPRVQICQGIFQELTETYLPDAKVEIFTGEFKYTSEWGRLTPVQDYFSSDVVITTIDQILGSIITHTNVNSLIPFMDSHVIFDEYHEYIGMDIFNILFAELIANKNMHREYNKNVLLVSATSPYLYLKQVLNINEDHVIGMPSFNQSQYKINFIDYNEYDISQNPFYQNYNNKSFIISNTAQTAQLGFIYNKETENSVLFHSKYKKSDKKYLFNEIYECFKKSGSQKYDVLRSGPIVQASLNISCDHMLSEMTSPENMLQRLGRLDRFGENQDVNILQIAITENVKQGTCKGTSALFLNQLNQLQTSRAWYNHLYNKIDNRIFKLSEIYSLYKDFYNTDFCCKAAIQDMNKALKRSIELLNKKITEPTKIIKNNSSNYIRKISKNSLRGDSRFVQLAVVNLNDFHHPVFENFYAYPTPLDDNSDFDNLTESLNIIRDLGLIQFMAQKHGNIDITHPIKGIPYKKIQLRCDVLENYARDAEYPLYLSYIEDDLNKIGGALVRNEAAIYYAVCDKQSIGLISLDKLPTKK